ncbi:MAG: class I SAM-dependent methyltransferase [Bdellovibrionales bacterium]
MAEAKQSSYIVILYTTIYRTGGDKFARAARTMRAEKQTEFPNCKIVCQAVESKAGFLDEVQKIKSADGQIKEFHFIGHSGVYGIMFGTTAWPEQFSPFEWKSMEIPFASDGHFIFHACRTARWFAPFIARTLHVRTSGNYWYTTVSRAKDYFLWENPLSKKDSPLYLIAVPGKKSHGILASLKKYFGFREAFPMSEFAPSFDQVDSSYDSVAELYDDTFEDIGVRADEWSWITGKLGQSEEKTILDIGCGNGALLQKLSGRIGHGVGVDISQGMLDQAQKRCAGHSNLEFKKLDGPSLPFPDNTFDSVTTVLSFRYLDWDPIVQEILRVLKPGGEIIVLDMVAAPVKLTEIPAFVKSKVELMLQRVFQRRYWQALRKMVTDPRWQTMLKYNPMRSEHEMKWFFESRFPTQKADVINVGWNSRILAFHTGPVHTKQVERMLYP